MQLTLTEKETEVKTTPSFSLSSLKSEQTGQAGGTLSDLVKLQAKDGFSGKVTLFVADPPDGVKVVFDPKEVTLTAEEPLQTSQMTITLGAEDIVNNAAFTLETISEGTIMNNIGATALTTLNSDGSLVSGSDDNIRYEII